MGETNPNPKGKKQFTREALRLFPKTCAYIRELPFASIGSVKLLGVAPHDYGTTHRDREGKDAERQEHFITVCPEKEQTPFTCMMAETRESHTASSRSYWFNDGDYHGVPRRSVFSVLDSRRRHVHAGFSRASCGEQHADSTVTHDDEEKSAARRLRG